MCIRDSLFYKDITIVIHKKAAKKILCHHVIISPPNHRYTVLSVSYTHLEALTDAMESDACYYADATFGTKTYPLVLSSALHLSLIHIYTRWVGFAKGEQ